MHITERVPHAQVMSGNPHDSRMRRERFVASVNADVAGLVAQRDKAAKRASESRYTKERDCHLAVLAEVERELRVIRKFGLIQRLDAFIKGTSHE